jgi:peptide/nickel transport system permease protein
VRRRGRWHRLRHSPLVRNPVYLTATVVVIVIVLMGVLAPLAAPYGPNQTDLANALTPASAQHWLGTDKQGRDILSRIIWGTRPALLSALLVIGLSGLLGVPLAVLGGFFGGAADAIINRAWDVVLSIPPLLLAFVTATLFGGGIVNAVASLSIAYAPLIARVVRALVLREREMTYVESAGAIGASTPRILGGHLLPNILTPIVVQSSVNLAYAILDLSALSYLGLGIQPPTADWGAMLSSGREYLLISPNVALASGIAIMVTVVAFNLFSDGLEKAFEPKR